MIPRSLIAAGGRRILGKANSPKSKVLSRRRGCSRFLDCGQHPESLFGNWFYIR